MLPTIEKPGDAVPVQPRAIGALRLSSRQTGETSVLSGLRQSGASKVLFPRSGKTLQALMLNTSGGITGGDRFEIEAHAGAGSALSMTTQAAERAYRANGAAPGVVETSLRVGEDALLEWLPQELILYDGCFLRRRLSVELELSSRLLMVEPIILGRAAMGERLHHARFADRIEIRRAGRPLYLDAIRLEGDVAAHVKRPAIGGGAGAVASLVYVAPDAGQRLDRVRSFLPAGGGASLLHDDVLVLRVVAADGFDLRECLLPVLDLLTEDTLPISWRL